MIVTSAKYLKQDDDSSKDNIAIEAVINDIKMIVPIDTTNIHYQEIQKWVDAGNSITAAD